MLQFSIHDTGALPRGEALKRAHLLGPDDIAIPGRIEFESNRVRCSPKGSGAAALALQYRATPFGETILQTCLLPQRQQPYSLTLELARHRIKQFIAKCEEWQMFELTADDPAMASWELARERFTDALNAPTPADVEDLGRRSLVRGLEATELLALQHADILLHRRFADRAASSTTLGVRVIPDRSPASFSDLLDREFDLLYLPIIWRQVEPVEGKYDWRLLDQWMQWAQRHNKPVVAGPLVDFSAQSVPDWIYVWQNDYDTLRDLAYDHAEKILRRYRNTVSVWSAIGSLNVPGEFKLTPPQILDLTRMANLLVRQGTRARTILEITQPFGEFAGDTPETLGPMALIERVAQEGIRFDCYGVQLVVGSDGPGCGVRDLMQISSLLDRFFLLELPVILTRFSMPAAAPPETGWWREAFSPDLQSQWAGHLYRIALSKPYIDSVIWGHLFDSPLSDLPDSGLVGEDGRPRKALAKIVEQRRRMRKPLGALNRV